MFIIAKEKFDNAFEAKLASYNGHFETLMLNQAIDIDDAMEKAKGIIDAQSILDDRRIVIYKKTGSSLTRVSHEKLFTVYLDRSTGEIESCKHLMSNGRASSALH
tara:strand:- start:1056 stop:1370 length:315 start_codon:yes stop_codon:yes gene_type:complete